MAMTSEPIRFTDGAGYDRFMGVWSRLAGQDFLDWIAPRPGLRWLDVGCGNGAFTQLIVEQSAPLSLVGIDPSEAQLAFARQHPLLQSVEFVNADAMASCPSRLRVWRKWHGSLPPVARWPPMPGPWRVGASPIRT
jgi:trans-aconitate methyltransferase